MSFININALDLVHTSSIACSGYQNQLAPADQVVNRIFT